RHGSWRWWSLEGDLLEDAHYAHGKRHGVSRFYVPGAAVGADAELRQLSEFDNGLEHGRCFERLEPGTHIDDRIVSREGRFQAGRMFGAWTYANAAGECV